MSHSHLAMGWCDTVTIEPFTIISTLLDDRNIASGSSGAGVPPTPEYPMVGWEEQLNLQLEIGGGAMASAVVDDTASAIAVLAQAVAATPADICILSSWHCGCSSSM